ncbi:MAG: hypothetical protein B6D46_04705 [Polyangiaceae bacterium UTPRO1]|jgi:hypothetical protein|nr:hypothetical protein [Myxococcales bacterium]OQY67979.1 MAG: hypothetical protein B6D46_04705 [Polyangiaceae bacterium UTPRO1]
MHLGLWSSIAIVFGFSIVVIALDEYVAKPWRQRRWQARAESGDKEAQELLKVARSAKVYDE